MQSLRRSCAACSKSKLKCDLRLPRCSRCNKRGVHCLYTNEPLAAPSAISPAASVWGMEEPMPPTECTSLSIYRFESFDPFDSYPRTRLPREHVQRLIHSFLNKISFEYYPLDLKSSNPFLVSWWPLALGDPALFHVSLSTASLDEELLAQRGFQASDLLMADSVSLLRRKIENQSLAIQDGTMNSVITLAAIEFGKGNTKVSDLHVDGVKKLVHLRGGIASVRQTSPLTARMVAWVSMLVTGRPQFQTQDDLGNGDGVPPIPEWQFASKPFDDDVSELGSNDIEPTVKNVFLRLRAVCNRPSISSTRLHDLVCFVIHRLLLVPGTTEYESSPITQCLRHAIMAYMFIIQGPTYFPHAVILDLIVTQFIQHLKTLESIPRSIDSFDVWLLAIGMAASANTANYEWFVEKAHEVIAWLHLNDWEDVFLHIKWILWLELSHAEDIFRPHWDSITAANRAGSPSSEICISPISSDAVLL